MIWPSRVSDRSFPAGTLECHRPCPFLLRSIPHLRPADTPPLCEAGVRDSSSPRTHTEGPAGPLVRGNPATSSARVPMWAKTRELASLHRSILGPGDKGGRGCGGEKGGGDRELSVEDGDPAIEETATRPVLSGSKAKSYNPRGGRERNKQPWGMEVTKRAGGERETESVQGNKQKGQCLEELSGGPGRRQTRRCQAGPAPGRSAQGARCPPRGS